MKKNHLHIVLAILVCLLVTVPILSQETVFSGLGSSLKRADKYYNNQSYQNAYDLYKVVEEKGKSGNEIYLKLARTAHNLNKIQQVASWYEKYLETSNSLEPEDVYLYAESLTALGQYQQAISWLKEFQSYNSDNQDIIEKIWRIQNIQHLYADSSFFEVNPLDLNTKYAEYGPSYLHQGLLFVSNRKEKGGISKIDRVTGQPFQSLYYVELKNDSVAGGHSYGTPTPFLQKHGKKLHQGTASVHGEKILFTSSDINKTTGESTLQLYWANLENEKWAQGLPFEHNSGDYSLSYPSFSPDGNTIYLVSDKSGGYGGTDIYKCTWDGQSWSDLVNLGAPVNTTGDETAPFVHSSQTLYFASNGHGGFGGLDIFKMSLDPKRSGEVENMGYPVNTSNDDFGLILNDEGIQGFLSSNRDGGGFNDDLFEVVVDLQSYPLVISGFLRYNDPDWGNQSRLETLGGAKMILVDHIRNAPVYETVTGDDGEFTIEIPYSSRYKIKVVNAKVGEPSVSLEIPKNRKLHTNHEIVVVKEKFKDSKSETGPEASLDQSTGSELNQKRRW